MHTRRWYGARIVERMNAHNAFQLALAVAALGVATVALPACKAQRISLGRDQAPAPYVAKPNAKGGGPASSAAMATSVRGNRVDAPLTAASSSASGAAAQEHMLQSPRMKP